MQFCLKNKLLCSCVPSVASGKAERLCFKYVLMSLCLKNRLLCYYVIMSKKSYCVLNKLLCYYVLNSYYVYYLSS